MMTIIVLLTLWVAVALLTVGAFSFGAAVGRRRGYEEAQLRPRERHAPSPPFGPLARPRHAAPRLSRRR